MRGEVWTFFEKSLPPLLTFPGLTGYHSRVSSHKREKYLENLVKALVDKRAKGQDLDKLLSIGAYMVGKPDSAINDNVDELNNYLADNYAGKLPLIDVKPTTKTKRYLEDEV